MSARKKTTRRKAGRSRNAPAGTRAAAAIDRLEQELPENLRDYVRNVRSGLTALEKQIQEARRDARVRWTRLLREASHELGKLEERGERVWQQRAIQARRDAASLLRRLEKVIEPKRSRKKAASKKAGRKKASRKKATSKRAGRKKATRRKV